MKIVAISLFVICMGLNISAAYSAQAADVSQAIINRSIASYPGKCPCPYSVDRAGHQCGRRSAYSRPGGYSPVCYPKDITNQMLKDYQREHPAQ